jgi:hypothetical protein
LLVFRLGFLICLLLAATPAWCQTQPQVKPSLSAEDLDLNIEVIENSPVLQRWLHQLPDVLEDIKNDPSFPTRLRFGYAQFPSTGQSGGVSIGVEDIFIGNSRFTISAEYQAAFNGKREAYGADLRYYLRPLGSYINIAPILGYRHLENNLENNHITNSYSTSGVNVGARLLFVLSRGGGADISLTQSWVAPGTDEEVGLTTLSFAYAVTNKLRFSTDVQKQNARQSKDSRIGLLLEWML